MGGERPRALALMELDRGRPPSRRRRRWWAFKFAALPLLLMLVPDSVLDFEIERTSVEFAPAVLGAIRRKAGGHSAARFSAPPRTARRGRGPVVVSRRIRIRIARRVEAQRHGLSVSRASPGLVPPACASRSYRWTSPPAWASVTRADATSRRWRPRARPRSSARRVRLGLAGIRWPDAGGRGPAAGGALAAAMLLMLSVPFLVQGHLNGALVAWYSPCPASCWRRRRDPRRARLKAEVTSHAVKVAGRRRRRRLACLACLLGAKRRLEPSEEEIGSLTGVIPPRWRRSRASSVVVACWGGFTTPRPRWAKRDAPFAP